MKKRLVVGLSGASGAILCVSLLEAMRREKDWEVHLVASEAGERVLREETGMSGADPVSYTHLTLPTTPYV